MVKTQRWPEARAALLGACCAASVVAGCGGREASAPAANVAGGGEAAAVQFVDITARAGINFVHRNGAFGGLLLPETMGSGAAFIDFDGDGYQDIFLVNGRSWTPGEVKAFRNRPVSAIEAKVMGRDPSRRPAPSPGYARRTTGALYRNNGDGTFRDVTRGSGLDVEMYGMGAAVGDYDNDGRDDLYVTAVGRNYLFRNTGRGRFADVSEATGTRDAGWSTAAAFVDYDRDGRLDLFVGHYISWAPSTDLFYSYDEKNKGYSTPQLYPGQANRLFRNRGGKFQDVSRRAGITEQASALGRRSLAGKALGAAVCDENGDGWPDIVVANDTVANYLYRNNRDGTFGEIAEKMGVGYSEMGTARGGMGVDSADLDHSGREAIVVGNFSGQMLGLYEKRDGVFSDTAPRSAVGRDSLAFLTFGCLFLDYDNDTWPDILAVNGHLDKAWSRLVKDAAHEQRALLFRNQGSQSAQSGGRFREVALQTGAALGKPILGRGLACADIDLDGDLDLLLTVNDAAPMLLRNDGGSARPALRVVLEGSKSNRSGIGALVEAKVAGATVRRWVRSGSSYLSQSELPLTIGLGEHGRAESLTVRWPSGQATMVRDVVAGQVVRIQEGKGLVSKQPLAGARGR